MRWSDSILIYRSSNLQAGAIKQSIKAPRVKDSVQNERIAPQQYTSTTLDYSRPETQEQSTGFTTLDQHQIPKLHTQLLVRKVLKNTCIPHGHNEHYSHSDPATGNHQPATITDLFIFKCRQVFTISLVRWRVQPLFYHPATAAFIYTYTYTYKHMSLAEAFHSLIFLPVFFCPLVAIDGRRPAQAPFLVFFSELILWCWVIYTTLTSGRELWPVTSLAIDISGFYSSCTFINTPMKILYL